MDLLPDPDQRLWLLAVLEDLVEQRGPSPLARPPLLPTATDFPDRWTPDPAGILRVLRRLLGHAGLGERGVHLDVEPSVRADLPGVVHDGCAASRAVGWFAGAADDGSLRFGCLSDVLDDPVLMVAVLAHEVAHAYRRTHGLEHTNRDLEEKLTDATTVYLGTGVFTASAAMRFRSGAAAPPGLQWTAGRAGYLGPQSLCFLLAAQAAARGLGWWDRWRLGQALTANQRACFHAATTALRPWREDLRAMITAA